MEFESIALRYSNTPSVYLAARRMSAMHHNLSSGPVELKTYALARAGCAPASSSWARASGQSGATGLTSTVAP